MANIIKIPAVNQSYEYPGQPAGTFKRDITNAINTLRSNYSSELQQASVLTGLPIPIIIGFSAVEDTTVSPTLRSPAGAIGLMQVQPASAADAIHRQAPQMSGQEIAFIKKYAPNAFTSSGKVASVSELQSMMTSALNQPAFNLYVGALMLAQFLIRSKKKYGQFRLDHAIIEYNAGQGNFTKQIEDKGIATADTATIVQNIPYAETRNYILKVMGVNGTLDVLKKMGLTS